jgi:hypothetical protein
VSRSGQIERARAAHYEEDGPADPDRAWAWRNSGDGAESACDDDGPIDTDASYAAHRRLFPGAAPMLPSLEALERLAREG